MSKNMRLLVSGASGHLGQRVLELLLQGEPRQLVAATRTPEKLAHFKAQGVEIRFADFNDPASLDLAFAGINRFLLISTDALDGAGTRLKQHRAAVQAAERAGVQHVVYTSLAQADKSLVLFAPDHAGTEAALAQSSLSWTILRNNLYTDFLLGSLTQAYQLGGLFKAAGEGRVAYVTREDCAQAAAAALAADFTGKRILEISGPAALNHAEIADLVASITGQPLKYVPVSLETVIQGMVGAGLPQPVAEVYASIDTAIAAGQLATVSNAVAELSGHQPTSIADFLAAQQAAFTPAV
ncbi:MAG TPA: SDR family oxidoreductase [Phototrophicaceae bacterium]|nr:SDR family oxidoreductase [Phototrophicaceae bacterium]